MHAPAPGVQIPALTEFHGLLDRQKLIGVTRLEFDWQWLAFVRIRITQIVTHACAGSPNARLKLRSLLDGEKSLGGGEYPDLD